MCVLSDCANLSKMRASRGHLCDDTAFLFVVTRESYKEIVRGLRNDAINDDLL